MCENRGILECFTVFSKESSVFQVIKSSECLFKLFQATELNYLQFYSLLMASWASFFPCVRVDWLDVEKLRYMEFRTYFSYNKLYIICFVNPPFIQSESRMKSSLLEGFFCRFLCNSFTFLVHLRSNWAVCTPLIKRKLTCMHYTLHGQFKNKESTLNQQNHFMR